MSAKNKPQAKIFRAIRRAERPHPERRPISGHDLEQVQAALAVHTRSGRCSAAVCRYFSSVRGDALVMPAPVVRPFAVKLFEKLASLPLAKVIRKRSQFAVRAAGAKYRLEALSPNSQFRPALQRVQDANLFAFQQAEAEIKARALRAEGKLA